ncbi:MAG: cell division protein FtsQ/DivIB [Oscillospiraceae bacterium]
MTQPRRHRRSRRKRQGNFAFLYRLLTFVMICGAIVAALSLFFKADQIFVTGASRYSQQQVLQASGIRQGRNLFLLNKHQAAAAITDQLPYVESVRIRRQLPNALRIEITECTHPLALEQDGALWLLKRQR